MMEPDALAISMAFGRASVPSQTSDRQWHTASTREPMTDRTRANGACIAHGLPRRASTSPPPCSLALLSLDAATLAEVDSILAPKRPVGGR